MRDSLRDEKGGGRIIRGYVSSAGVVLGGTGFTVTRTAVGRYTLNFLTPFGAPPIVYGTQLIDAGSEWFGLNGAPAAGSAAVYTTKLVAGAVNFTDEAFEFTAIEQER